MKLKNQLIKAIENYVDTVMLPASYGALLSVFHKFSGHEVPPLTLEEWNQAVLDEMKTAKEKE